MEDKESTSPSNPSLEGNDDFSPSIGFEVQKVGSELDGTTQVVDISGHVPKPVHQFYFVKLWPTDPDSISQIKKEERVVEKLNQDIRQINDQIKEKMLDRSSMDSGLKTLYRWQMIRRSLAARKGQILNCLYVALGELCFINNAPKRRSDDKTRFEGELDNHNLNALMQHGSKSLAEEKKILRDINTQDRDVASFQSLEVLKKTIQWSYYEKQCQKLPREIEQFQTHGEGAAGNASVKGKILRHVSLKKDVKDQIKLFCDDSLEIRIKGTPDGTGIRRAEKKLEVINQAMHSLRTTMEEKREKKVKAYESIFRLKELYDEEITNYYKYSSLIDKVHQLAEGKNITALDELSRSEVGKFMLEWNTNKAFREDYEKKVLQSLDRRQLSRDGCKRLAG